MALPGRRCPRPDEADPELIDKAATLLAGAKKPLLFVGGGAVAAAEEVLAIAEMLQAPVISYTGGKGIVSDRHYLAQTALAGHELWCDADVVLAVGTRLHQPQMRWGVDADLKLIRIDIDPREITRIAKACARHRRRCECGPLGAPPGGRSAQPETRLAQGRARGAEGAQPRPARRPSARNANTSRRSAPSCRTRASMSKI